jgi:LysR family glycine cleavage system transcriptional activator
LAIATVTTRAGFRSRSDLTQAPVRVSVVALVGANHITPGEGLTFSDYNLAVQAAIAGQGVVLGSLPILRNLVVANLLVSPLPDVVATDIGYDLVTTERALARAEVTRFVDWIIEQARS